MSVLFQRPSGPTLINTVRINQSVLGFPVPVVLGAGKVQQSLLWVDGFTNKTVSTSSGGKGFGGGKGGSEYVYSADVIAGLCDGGQSGIIGLGDVWSGQSWLSNNNTSESYTIGGGLSYTPVNASNMSADQGVAYTIPLNASYNDLTSTTTLATELLVPLKRVSYVSGQTLSAGTYSVDSGNTYHFSAANTGVTVQLYYSFALSTVKKQENAIIASSLTVTVGDSSGKYPWTADCGVVYYSTGTNNPLNGKSLTRVYGTPTQAGTYSVSGTSPATYRFASGDINQEVQITWKQDNSNALPSGTPTSLAFELITGTPTDTPAAILQTNFPSAAVGYPGIAKVLYAPMDLGYGAQIQQNTFEVFTADMWGGGIIDCSPIQCILQVLTNQVWGLGNGPVPFPLSAIDSATGGTWGTPTPTGVAQAGSTASNWFAANSFFISPVIDRQDTAASLIGRWLEAGMCATFMSEGLMKLVPYGDTSTAGNGATWVAPSSFDAELDDTCFLVKSKGQDPVKISSSPWTEAYNTVQVSWNNRGNQYAQEVTPASDKAAILRYGSRIEDSQAWDFITTLAAATFAGSMRVKRNVYTRNTYEFSLPFRFGHLEAMGVVSLTTNSAWNASTNNTIQLVRCPVRITKVVDNPDGTYDVTCEDLISGAHTPDGFSKTTSSPTPSPNQYADPGNTVAVFMDAPLDLKIYSGNELWIGAVGVTANWGGCTVYASTDGDKYKPIGTINSTARLGTLNAAFPAGSDPDTAHTLVVNLEGAGNAVLEAGTQNDADNANTLCWVDGELLAYSACALSGPDQYSMGTYIRRGLMGTTAGAHAANSQFLRLDDSLLRYAYDSSWIGKTVYLKFQSFNSFGNSTQDISTLTAYDYTPGGTNYPAPPVVTISQSTSTTSSTGIVTTSSGLAAVSTVYVTVSWSWPANFPEPSGFNVVLFEGADPTNTTNYIAPVATVGASARSYTFAVSPNSSMTNVNAAVEAVYA